MSIFWRELILYLQLYVNIDDSMLGQSSNTKTQNNTTSLIAQIKIQADKFK